MKANELRIGNAVEYHMVDTFGPIDEWIETSIDWEDLKGLSQHEDSFNEWHQPIPLTEEWLLRFGFEKHESKIIDSYSISISRYKTLKDLCVTIQFGNEYISIREGEQDSPSTTDIVTTLINGDIHGRPFYVHQLQNLYFALTGEELQLQK